MIKMLMPIDLRELLLFIHILLGIVWLGGILFVGWGVFPTINRLPPQVQRQFLTTMMQHTHKLLTLAGASVIATGIVLGTFLGPVKHTDVLFSTQYGKLFLLAFVLATVGLFWGARISYPVTMRMLADEATWKTAINGFRAPLKTSMQFVTMVSAVEVVLLFIVVWIMVIL